MMMQDQFNRTVIPVGGSKAVTIPIGVAEQMKIEEGEEIEVFIRKKP